LGDALLTMLNDVERRQQIAEAYQAIHHHLRCNAADSAAMAILNLLGRAS
jgi:lipid A disaccharide synthetase